MNEVNDVIVSDMGIELPGLVKVLANSLYSNREIALRELIQNANDACVRHQVQLEGTEQGGRPPSIRINFNPAGVLSIEDDGLGMTKEDIQKYLSTIGKSGTREFRNVLKQKDREAAYRLIGTFGLGLLAAFVIADKVEVETRSISEGGQGYKWECDGNGKYQLTKQKRDKIGTKTTLHISREHVDLLVDERLRDIIKRYADFISFPIYMGTRGFDRVNVMNAPWHEPDAVNQSREQLVPGFLQFLKARYGDQWDEPVAVFPITIEQKIEHKNVRIGGVLYVPSRPDEDIPNGTVDLYVSRMFIRSNMSDLLPKWAVFISGILDTPSINVLVSREDVRRDDASVEAVRNSLEDEIIRQIHEMAVKQGGTLSRILLLYDTDIKLSALKSKKFFKAVCDIIRFQSDRVNSTTLPDYLARAQTRNDKEGDVIYYFSQPQSRAQYVRLFQEKDVEVLDASGRYDAPFLEHYAQIRDNVRARRLDIGADYLFESLDDTQRVEWGPLEDELRRIAHDGRMLVKTVQFEPADIPAILTYGKEVENVQAWRKMLGKHGEELPDEMRDMFENLVENATAGAHAGTLNLNAKSKLLRQILDILASDYPPEIRSIATTAMHQIYHSARQFAQEDMTQDMLQHVYELNNDVLSRVCEQTKWHMDEKAKKLQLESQVKTLTKENADLKDEVKDLQKQMMQG